MTGYDNQLFNLGGTKICDAGFDYGSVAKRKQRLESSHPARTAGGENDCRKVSRTCVRFGGHKL
jgi:hypothetical protein